MPTLKPSDKSSNEGEWWRKDKSNQEQGEVAPENGQGFDEAEIGKNMFDEAQKPVHYPSSG